MGNLPTRVVRSDWGAALIALREKIHFQPRIDPNDRTSAIFSDSPCALECNVQRMKAITDCSAHKITIEAKTSHTKEEYLKRILNQICSKPFHSIRFSWNQTNARFLSTSIHNGFKPSSKQKHVTLNMEGALLIALRLKGRQLGSVADSCGTPPLRTSRACCVITYEG
eukprot:409666-Amphidinium_carterae.1